MSWPIIAGITSICASGAKDTRERTAKPVVAVSILPQQYFVNRIAENRVTALVLVGPGQSPHSYEPTPAQMAALSKASAWITQGTDFEIGLEPKIAAQFPNLKTVHGTDGVKLRELQEYEQELGEEHHEEGEAHHDANIDRHTWIGRIPAKIMAAHIRDALAAVDPVGKDAYTANGESLLKDMALAP